MHFKPLPLKGESESLPPKDRIRFPALDAPTKGLGLICHRRCWAFSAAEMDLRVWSRLSWPRDPPWPIECGERQSALAEPRAFQIPKTPGVFTPIPESKLGFHPPEATFPTAEANLEHASAS